MIQEKKADIYVKAVGFNSRLENSIKDFPRRTYYLTNLLKKAAGSIPDQLAQAHTEELNDDKKDLYWSARGSICECSELIEVAARQGYLDEGTRNAFRTALTDLGKMVQDMIRNSPQISEN